MYNVKVNTGLNEFLTFKQYELLLNNYELKESDIPEIENWWIENIFPEYHQLLCMFNRNVFSEPPVCNFEYTKENELFFIQYCNKIIRFKGNIRAIELLLTSLRFDNTQYTVDDDYNYTFLLSVPEADNFKEIEFRQLFYECCFKLLWFTDIKIKYKLLNVSTYIEQKQKQGVSISIFNNIELEL